jgi:hypothetical protein
MYCIDSRRFAIVDCGVLGSIDVVSKFVCVRSQMIWELLSP